MKDAHDFPETGMIPLKTLLSFHEDDHADTEPKWYGSPDSSRSPGFTAMTRRAAADDPWWRAMDSLRQSGFPDSQMRLDTGHSLYVHHQGSDRSNPLLFSGQHGAVGYHAQVWHPNAEKHYIHGYLGDNPEHVGPLLRRMFMNHDVLDSMRGQMQGFAPSYHYVDMTQGR